LFTQGRLSASPLFFIDIFLIFHAGGADSERALIAEEAKNEQNNN
jgi:hypothetical protein